MNCLIGFSQVLDSDFLITLHVRFIQIDRLQNVVLFAVHPPMTLFLQATYDTHIIYDGNKHTFD